MTFVKAMKNICIFCSANELPEKYTKPAEEFVKIMVKQGDNMVWGGTDQGLMKRIADQAQMLGGKIIGISVEFLHDKARKNADEMIVTKDLSDRKALMLQRSDAFVIMVGGVGTLDEITEVIELKKHGAHHKPIVVLNTDNFYAGLKEQLHTMEREGFLTGALDELLYFADTPWQALEYINKSV